MPPMTRRVSEVTQIVQALPLQVPSVSHIPITGVVPWLVFAFACLLQANALSELGKSIANMLNKIRRKKITLKTLKEMEILKVALDEEKKLKGAIEIQGKEIAEGTRIDGAEEALRGEPPQKIYYRKPSRFGWLRGKRAEPWRRAFLTSWGVLCLARGPALMQSWGFVLTAVLAGWVTGYVPKRLLPDFAKMVGKVHLASVFTGFAWFAHRVAGYWRKQNSRGRAIYTDVLGGESSLREARVNAMKVFVQFLIWSGYAVAVLATAGISPSNVLLVPGVAAVLLGWVGRQVLANIISGLVLHLTQPFAQGDWVTVGDVDGWVQDAGIFYTKIMQWDKRPMYIPNSDIMATHVQNNSRMTNRRVLFELRIPLRYIPQIPQIVQDLQEMVESHQEIDNIQHRLVRWRKVDEFCGIIWLSCYTLPTWDSITLKTFTKIEQSVLERATAIIYKRGAEFANSLERQIIPVEGLQKAQPEVQVEPSSQAEKDASTKAGTKEEEEASDEKQHEVVAVTQDDAAEQKKEEAWKAREEALWARETVVMNKEKQIDERTIQLHEDERKLDEDRKQVVSVLDAYKAIRTKQDAASDGKERTLEGLGPDELAEIDNLTEAVKQGHPVVQDVEEAVTPRGSEGEIEQEETPETGTVPQGELMNKIAGVWTGEKPSKKPEGQKKPTSSASEVVAPGMKPPPEAEVPQGVPTYNKNVPTPPMLEDPLQPKDAEKSDKKKEEKAPQTATKAGTVAEESGAGKRKGEEDDQDGPSGSEEVEDEGGDKPRKIGVEDMGD